MSQTPTKNEFMTVRDPGHKLRGMIDELRIIEGAGTHLPPDRTEMLKRCVERCLAEKKSRKIR